MSSSPYQFVPSTPCINMSHRISGWNSYNSPAAVVPECRETHQANNDTGFSTPIAVVPSTPNFQDPMNTRRQSRRRSSGINLASPFMPSPRVGQCAEQIVPSTPQGTTYTVSWDSRGQTTISHNSHRTTPKPSRRENILKQRLSPRPVTRARRKSATDLFSDDQIFS